MTALHPYSIFPLGDSALTIDFGNIIDRDVNNKVLRLYNALLENRFPHIIDIIPSYSSIAIRYDVAVLYKLKQEDKSVFDGMAEMIENLPIGDIAFKQIESRLIKIPVCYRKDHAPDINELASGNNIPVEEVIRIHSEGTYRVYMLGFLPGFAYMASVDEKIAMPRRNEPKNVAPGSVGIAGIQTGVYPLESPGGWNIIGRTPMKIFDKESERPIFFQPGDEVKFYPITEDEFENY